MSIEISKVERLILRLVVDIGCLMFAPELVSNVRADLIQDWPVNTVSIQKVQGVDPGAH